MGVAGWSSSKMVRGGDEERPRRGHYIDEEGASSVSDGIRHCRSFGRRWQLVEDATSSPRFSRASDGGASLGLEDGGGHVVGGADDEQRVNGLSAVGSQWREGGLVGAHRLEEAAKEMVIRVGTRRRCSVGTRESEGAERAATH